MVYTEIEKSYQDKEVSNFLFHFHFLSFFFFLVIEFSEDKELLIKYIVRYSLITYQHWECFTDSINRKERKKKRQHEWQTRRLQIICPNVFVIHLPHTA